MADLTRLLRAAGWVEQEVKAAPLMVSEPRVPIDTTHLRVSLSIPDDPNDYPTLTWQGVKLSERIVQLMCSGERRKYKRGARMFRFYLRMGVTNG